MCLLLELAPHGSLESILQVYKKYEAVLEPVTLKASIYQVCRYIHEKNVSAVSSNPTQGSQLEMTASGRLCCVASTIIALLLSASLGVICHVQCTCITSTVCNMGVVWGMIVRNSACIFMFQRYTQYTHTHTHTDCQWLGLPSHATDSPPRHEIRQRTCVALSFWTSLQGKESRESRPRIAQACRLRHQSGIHKAYDEVVCKPCRNTWLYGT